MKKNKIKFLFFIFAAFGFIFFFVPETQAAGCCRCKGSYADVETFSCMDDVVNEEICKSAIIFPITACDFFDNKPCTDILECPQAPPPKYEYEPVYPSLQIPIPGIPSLTEFAKVEIKGEPGERYVYIPWIGQYISALYGWAIGIVGVLATVMIIWGGVIYLTAGGSPERISTAKSYIASALTGLVLAFGSYLLLYTINPDLVRFGAMKIKVIERLEYHLTEEDIGRQDRPNLVSIENIENIVFHPTVEIKQLRKETADKLKEAAQALKNEEVVLQINDATRSYEKQLRLYNQYGKGRACYPKKDEYNCPHIAGIAIDAVCQGKQSSDPCQEKVKKAMYKAGFCRYAPEAWHFEYPQMSRNCVKD